MVYLFFRVTDQPLFHIIGITKFLRWALTINAVLVTLLATLVLDVFPTFPIPSLVPLSVAAVSLSFLVLGQTRLFPKICRLPGVWKLFPNIDGTYDVEVASNWPGSEPSQSNRQAPDGPTNKPDLYRKRGTIEIVARLMSVQVRYSSNDGYSWSETVACSLYKNRESRLPTLYYIFESTSDEPELTDNQSHLGAARLIIPCERQPNTLKGHYWTDRNWHIGKNTAGSIVLRRQ